MSDSRTLTALRSTNATLIVLVLALVAQMPHAADVFRLIVYGDGIAATIHSYAFAVALELAVLLFVVQHRHRESYAFAAVSVAMNLAYYHLHDVELFSAAALPAWLVSVALPTAIARYSHAVADAAPVQAAQPRRPVATKTVRHAEHTEQVEVFGPEQLPAIDVLPANSLADATNEQKRQYLAELLAGGQPLNKSELARRLGVGRTTLHNWIAQVSA